MVGATRNSGLLRRGNETMSLRRAAFSAGRWTAASAGTRAVVQVLQTAILARILSPGDYGLMAIATSIIVVISLITDFGVSRALIHYDEVDDDTLSTLYWLNLGMAMIAMLMLIATAPLVASLYRMPELEPLLRVASFAFPLSAAGQQFRVMAEKGLNFASLARNEIAAALGGFLIALLAALAGMKVYTLVAGLLANNAISSGLAWLRLTGGRHLRLRMNLSTTKPFLKFGSYLVGENFASTLHRQADVFVGGLVTSPSVLGLFSVPRDLSFRVSTLINPIMTRVGFPVMSRAKSDAAKLKSIYLQSLRLTASLNFPIYMALALFAEEVITLLYGAKWTGAAPFLRLLAIWGMIRSTGNPVGSLLYAAGRAALAFWWNIVLLAVIPVVLFIASWHGDLYGMTIAMIGIQLAMLVPMWYWLVRPICDVTAREYLGQFIPPLFVSCLAAGAASLVTLGFNGEIMRLIIGVGCGTLVYLAASVAFNRPFYNALRDAVGPLLPRGNAR
jgi:O-antigen/teichoic acid export membrane protein